MQSLYRNNTAKQIDGVRELFHSFAGLNPMSLKKINCGNTERGCCSLWMLINLIFKAVKRSLSIQSMQNYGNIFHRQIHFFRKGTFRK